MTSRRGCNACLRKREGHSRSVIFRRRNATAASVCVLFFVALACVRGAAPGDYQTEVKSLLKAKCVSCHGRLQQKAGLRLDAGRLIHAGTKDGPVIRSGNSQKSELVVRVSSKGEDRMPPEGSPLNEAQIDTLKKWIDLGAKFPADEVVAAAPKDHWAWQPVRSPAIPVVKDTKWPLNPIDHFVLAKLEKKGWKPNPMAAPQPLLRRLHLDVTGLPPTLEEQDEAARESAPDWEKRVASLLARPSYGERWARHWLDLARYAESNAYERDAAKPFAWRYRDYVIKAFNDDKRLGRFIVEQIAGDELADANSETVIATGFLRLGPWDDEPADPATDRYDQLDDIVHTTAQVFLAQTIACARCHDHKFEPFSARDYYSLVAVFAPLDRPRDGRTERAKPAGSHEAVARQLARDQQIAGQQQQIEALFRGERKRVLEGVAFPAEVTQSFLTEETKRDARQRQLVKAHEPKLEEAARATMDAATKARLQNFERTIQEQRAATPDLPEGYFLHEPASRPAATHILLRGQPARLGAEVVPAAPAILGTAPFLDPGPRTSFRRLSLANWIASTNNPLTARVAVNHVWQHHFGAGLVRTPDDFGLMGETPTHPELLDWLAHWFVHEAGGSFKRLHQLILTSRAWQMSRADRLEYSALDPENRLLWRQPNRRLEVEAIRDSMLAVSGQLNPAAQGPSFFPPLPRQVLEGNSDPDTVWKASGEREASRRSVYAFIKRAMVAPLFEAFDLCDSARTSARRATTTTAPQALMLYNGDFVSQQARHMARRIEREVGEQAERQVERAFRLALARVPSAVERRQVLDMMERESAASPREGKVGGADRRDKALELLCKVMLNLNEFVYPD